jgi:hypothetical protein
MTNDDEYVTYEIESPFSHERMIAVLDADMSPVRNFTTICHFLGALPLSERVEMMMTLRAYINEEFR